MSKASAEASRDLVTELKRVREEKGGKLTIDDMTALIHRFAGSQADKEIQKELQAIIGKLQSTKDDLASLLPDAGDVPEGLSGVATQLDSVIRQTEEATSTILDAASAIQEAAGNAGPAGDAITAEVTKIFEACTFQDLTGQRIRKVLTTLAFVEEHVEKIASLFGGSEHIDFSKKRQKTEEEKLLEGPQLQAAQQDDIDAIFNSLE